jgi:putative membrane protein insertion efficiency factor
VCVSQTPPPLTILVVRRVLIFLVLLYRVTLGRLIGGHCRYTPSCSQYAIDAVNKHGPLSGSWRAVRRVCRCHPWGGHGYDPA